MQRSSSNRQKTLIVAVVAALLGFAAVALYMSTLRDAAPAATQTPVPVSSSAPATTPPANANVTRETGANEATLPADAKTLPGTTTTTAPPRRSTGDSLINTLFGMDNVNGLPVPRDNWTVLVPRIIIRLSLAALLVAALAFRPRRGVPALQRNPYVAQTQILLAVVASALMMIVGDSAARAFGIFAAASLVRFRTNIRDPKEITVLLISLAIGLATGVGRWELALTLALFVFPLLWVLEHYAYDQVIRAMQVTVKTRDLLQTQTTLIRIFRRHRFMTEVRQLDPPNEEDPIGCVVYYLNMNLNASTDELSEEIMSSDPEHIEGIEWEQQKNTGYVYQ